jgi:catechol 2,3-dioxygenase-like lactoylglutathione lyase family enzyme
VSTMSNEPGTRAAPETARVDHLVVVAASLEEGVAWCERTLGLTPGPGGQHPLMGTHNRLFRIDSPEFPAAYFEIIAIDPQAAAPGRRRWFDMDDEALRARVARDGPQLAHVVVRVADVAAATAAWRALGIERGEVLPASRPTPTGLLSWKIAVREDGQRLFDGTLPTLIEWGPVHPVAAMASSGARLAALTLRHPQAQRLQQALQAIGLAQVAVEPGDAALMARLHTPTGEVTLGTHARPTSHG